MNERFSPQSMENHNHETEEDHSKATCREKIKQIISSLPTDEKGMYFYQGFWCYPSLLEGIMLAQERFEAQPGDIFVCSYPKSGTTWMKALTFAIINRHVCDDSNNPLLFKGPHDIVLFLDLVMLENEKMIRESESEVPLIATHAPYPSLPKSVLHSDDFKIVYICRDPKDTFVSLSLFAAKRYTKDQVPSSLYIEQSFELFCEGKSVYGPIWDHILGYWKASLEQPKKVMFLKYEDLKKDCAFYAKKLAEFMGYPFSPEEEQDGTVQKIVELCSFENLGNLEVNKTGFQLISTSTHPASNQDYFRKGKVGDWRNYLTPKMAERLDKIMEQKLYGSGLTFRFNSSSS